MTNASDLTRPENRRSCAIAVVASAGGIPALIELLGSLPRRFSPPIVIAQHLARVPSNLDGVLSWRTGRAVCWAGEGTRPDRGGIYLAPPGASLQLTPKGFCIRPLPSNPASWLGCPDLLLESMAELYGSRLAAIVLSGALPTGLKGLKRVNAFGGVTMAQSGSSSLHFTMPCAAIDLGKAEIVTSPETMARMLEVMSEHWDSVEH